jgi:metal-responsive CopG/Arc/MetJ family transcriptional regulator
MLIWRVDGGITAGYTFDMKTAISLPDELFEQAERVARQLNMNRSQLYVAALREFLDKRDAESVTARLNEIYGGESSSLDPVVMEMQRLSLPKDEW